MSRPGPSHVDTRGVVSWLLGSSGWLRGGGCIAGIDCRHLLGTCSVQSAAQRCQRGQVGGARGRQRVHEELCHVEE